MLIDGKAIAEKIKEEVSLLAKQNPNKCSLVIFYVGQNEVIEKYIALKKRLGAELGIRVDVERFSENAPEAEVVFRIEEVLPNYAGAIVQLPLPPNFNREKVLNLVPPEKDVDVLSKASFEDFRRGEVRKMPTVVSAISRIVSEYKISLFGKKAVVLGRGALVGAPISAWLEREGVTYEVLDEGSADVHSTLKEADVIISGTGVAGLVKEDMVKDGVVIFDAGTSTDSGRLAGDVDPAAYKKASLVTPVPGGIGPITVVSLFKNLFLE